MLEAHSWGKSEHHIPSPGAELHQGEGKVGPAQGRRKHGNVIRKELGLYKMEDKHENRNIKGHRKNTYKF